MSSCFRLFSLALALAILIAAPVAGCGDDDEKNPVPELCKEQCKLEASDVCFGKMGECETNCNAVGVERFTNGYKPTECATCFVNLIGYSRDTSNSKCWGITLDGKSVASADKNNPKCADVCVEPL